jgi:disulfide bond formation protein DsbB
VFLILASAGLLLGTLYVGVTPEWKQKFHARHGLWVAFGFSFIASAMTLYYSEILGQAPCALCWVQRVFLYPQVVIFFIAAMSKDTRAVWYSIGLSVLGALVALYHHWLQMGGAAFFPCPASGPGIACEVPTFITWGFITFPFMALVLFVFLILYVLWLRTLWRKYQPEVNE